MVLLEKYIGVKFEVKTVEKSIEPDAIAEFLKIDRMIGEIIDPKANEGNLSMRYNDGFLIKRTGTRLAHLHEEDVVFVEKVQDTKVFSTGTPSSESIMHYEVYTTRSDVEIILHFHDEELLKKQFEAEVGPFPYGTKELATAVSESALNHDVIKIREHGFVILAKNKEELKEKLLGCLSC